MILNKLQIEAAGIVTGAVPDSKRSTTYDATIGDIVYRGKVLSDSTFTIEKRGVVWVVSAEEFALGETNTGLATLKTTWTHKGLLALNVGIIDPGWHGPLATALVNFSGQPIEIKRGQPFLRVLVFKHAKVPLNAVRKSRPIYLEEIQDRSRLFAETFLDTRALVDEVALAVFKFPKLAVVIGLAGLGVAMAAIFAPLAFTAWSNSTADTAAFAVLKSRVDEMERRHSSLPLPPAAAGSTDRKGDIKSGEKKT